MSNKMDGKVCHVCEEKLGPIQEGLSGNEYPCGTCPDRCDKCNAIICPQCGGELNVVSDSEEIEKYCGDGCECGWEHCGGCI